MDREKLLYQILGISDKNIQTKTDIVARYGSEEFVILMPEITIETAKNQAEKVREFFELNSLEFEGQTIHTTISVGLANIVPEPDMEKEPLLSKADSALYMAKSQGRNQVCVDLHD